MNILITGGTGFVGQRLVATLKEKHKLAILTRDAFGRENKGSVSYHTWNPLSGEPVPEKALAGVDGVINLMGENLAAKRWTAWQKQKLEKSRVLGTRNLINSLNLPLKFFISAGAIGIYPVNRAETITEQTPAGKGFLAELCQNWEKEVKKTQVCERTIILRIGVILEKGGGALSKMLFPFRMGLGGPIGNGRQIMSWVHLDDVVHVIASAVENTSYNGIYNVVAPEPVSNKEFAKALGRALGRPAFLPLPKAVLEVMMGEMSSLMLDSQRIVPQRLLDQGHKFLHPKIDSALKTVKD